MRDFGANEPVRMKRHEWWRKQYPENRYLVGFSDTELDVRFADIVNCSTMLSDEGKLSIAGIEWMERFAHVLEELGLRGRGAPYNSLVSERLAVPRPETPPLGPIIRASYPKGIPDKFTLFRYGKREFIEPLFHAGIHQLRPASFYDKRSLNFATRDKELEFEKIVGHRRYLYKSEHDFYMFCSAMFHSDRLFWDFEADSVLIVHNPHALFERLATALDEENFEVYFNRASYIDPALLGEHNHIRDIALVKHIRYAYQFEHRFIAKSPSPGLLEPRDFELGPLSDIAELLVCPSEAARAA